MNMKIWASLLGLLLLLQQTPVFAAPPGAPTIARPAAPSGTPGAATGAAYHGVDLNLGSMDLHLQANNNTPIQLQQEGTAQATPNPLTRLVQPGQLLTSAQYLAVNQILNAGRQTLLLNHDGIAIGGTASITPNTVSILNSLNLPGNVALHAIGFTQQTPLSVANATTVAGSLYALQTMPGLTSVMNLGSLTVAPGGLISGHLPSDGGAGIFASQSLLINVAGNVINRGSIMAPDVLTINAGGTISNVSNAAQQAVISAGTVNLFTATGNIVNSGLIAASAANLNINAALSNLRIENTGGTISALNGAINVRDHSFTEKYDLIIAGGDLLSKTLNLHAGEGTVNVNSNDITGAVNIYAGKAYLMASTPNLVLDTVTLTGDPIFYNTAGNIVLGALSTNGGDLAVLASGNVSITGAINTTPAAAGAGGDVWIVAGANIAAVGAGVTPTTTGTFTITNGGGGGNISATSIATNAKTANNAGGGIQLIAYANGATGGVINLTGGITSGGLGTGANGTVLAIAGQSAAGINLQTGLIDATGGTGANGTVSLYTSQPIATGAGVTLTLSGGGTVITQAQTFTPTGGLTLPTLNANAGITTGAIATRGRIVTALAGSDIVTGSINTTVSTVASAGGAIVLASSTGSITTGNLSTAGSSIGAGGAGANLALIAGGNITTGDITARAGGTGNNIGGRASLVAGALWTNTVANTIRIATATPQSAGGGAISINGGLATNSTGTAAAGAANLIAYQGTAGAAASGRISLTPASTIDMRAAGAGANGVLNIIAGDTDATAGTNVITTGNITTAGATATATGTVTLANTSPALTAANYDINFTTGTPTGGFAISTAIQNGDITTGSITTNGSRVQVLAGGNYTASPAANITTTRLGAIGAGGGIILGARTGSITVGSLDARGSLTGAGGAGGSITAIAGDSISGDNVLANGQGTGNNAGGQVNVVAGASWTLPTIALIRIANAAPQTVSGGQISLTGVTGISSASTGTASASSVNLIAFQGTTGTATSGRISTVGPIDMSAAGIGGNGSLLAIAGDTDATAGTLAISTGAITSRGTTSTVTGTITLATATPSLTVASLDINATTGAIGAGAFQYTTTALQSGDITTGSLSTNGTRVQVIAGGNLTSGDITTSRVTGTGAGGSVILGSRTGAMTVGTIDARGSSVTTGGAGGSVALISNGSLSVVDVLASAGGTGVNAGGQVNLLAGATWTMPTATAIRINSAAAQSATGGALNITGTTGIVTSSTSTGVSGNINLDAFQGTAGNVASGRININTTGLLDLRAAGTGANGSLVAVAGDTDASVGTSVITAGVVTSKGLTGTATGTLTLASATPSFTTSDLDISPTTGAITAGLFQYTTTALQSGDISTGAISSNGARIQVIAGGNLTTSSGDITSSRVGAAGAGGAIILGARTGAVSIGSVDSSGSSVAAGGAGASIAIISNGSISAGNALAAAGGTGNNAGGQVNLVAGAIWTIPTTLAIRINNAAAQSTTGGEIALTGATGIATGSTGTGTAGNANLAAFQGTTGTAASGRITLNTAGTIDLRAGGTGINGSLVAVAGDTEATVGTSSITTGSITSRGLTGTATGLLTLASATPSFTTVDLDVNATTGALTTGAFQYTPTAVQSGDITVGALSSNGTRIQVIAGGNLTSNGDVTSSRVGGTGAGGSVFLASRTGALSIGSVDARGSSAGVGGRGGSVALISSGSISGGDILAAAGGTAANAGGQINVVAGTLWTMPSTTVLRIVGATAESVSGGQIALTGTTGLTTTSTSTGAAGSVNLIAFQGTTGDAASGRITLNSTGTIDMRAGGTGANGSLVAVAGDTNAALGTNTLTTGAITSRGATGTATGTLTLAASTPSLTAVNYDINPTTSVIAAGGFQRTQASILSGDISTGNLAANGSRVQIIGGGNVITGDVTASRIGALGAGGAVLLASLSGSITAGIIDARASSVTTGGAGGSVALIAGNSVTAADVLAAAAGTGNNAGGQVNIIAGAAWTIPAATTLRITSAAPQTTTGGSITLTGSGGITSSSTGTGNAASVNLIAFQGTVGTAASGRISAASTNVDLRAATTGTNGSFTAIAGDTNGSTGTSNLSIGSVNSAGPTSATGTIRLANSTPLLSANFDVNITTSGSTGGVYSPTLTAIQAGDLSSGALSTNGTQIQVLAGGNVTTGAITAARIGAVGAGGAVVVASRSGSVATGNIDTRGSALTTGGAGGAVALVASENITTGDILASAQGSNNNAGGQVSLLAGALWTVPVANTLRVTSAAPQSTTGGSITSTGSVGIFTNSTGTGAGGAITLVAYEGTVGTASSGRITMPTTSTMDATGLGTGSHGTVTVIGADNDATIGTSAVATGNINTRGASSTGGAVNIGNTAPLQTTNLDVSLVTSVLTGTINIDPAAVRTGDVSTGAVTTNGQAIRILGGGNYTSNNGNIDSSRTIGVGAAGNITLRATNGSITIGNTNDILAVGNGAAPGTISLTAGQGVTVQDIIASSAGTFNGGSITIAAGSNVTMRDGIVSAAGTGLGGALSITSANLTSRDLLANGGSAVTAGIVTVNAAGTVSTRDVLANGLGVVNVTATGDITLGGNYGGGLTVNLTGTGTANILRTAGTVTATTVTLITNSGNIGSGALQAATNVFTDGTSLRITSATGSAVVTDLASDGTTSLLVSSAGSLRLASATGSNGNISATSTVTANTIELNADGSGSISAVGVVGNAAGTADVTLASGSGNIGTGAIRAATNVFTNAGNLTANTTGGVSVTDNASNGSVTITSASAGGANTLRLATATGSNGTLDFAGDATGPSIIIDAAGSGNILRTAGYIGDATGTATVSLTSATGNIGTGAVRSATNIFTNAGNLSANTAGNVAINDLATDGNVTVLGSSAGAANLFQLSTATGSNGTINVAGVINAGNITLDADGSGSITSTGVIGNAAGTATVILASGSGDLGTGAARALTNLFTNAGTLTATTTGSISITDNATDGGVTISSATAGAANSLTLATATGSNGTITFAGNATAGTVTINADGAGNITQTAGYIGNAAGTADVSLLSASGNIGTGVPNAVTNVFTNAGSLSVSTAGGVAITDNATDGAITISSASAGGANTLQLATATGSNGNLTFAGNALANNIAISADGSGNVLRTAGSIGNVAGTATVSLTSGTGDIGTGSVRNASNVFTNAGNLTVVTGGNVAVTDLASDGSVTITGSSAGAAGLFQLATNTGSNGSVVVSSALNAGDITIDADGSGSISGAGSIGNGAGTANVNLVSGTGTIGTGAVRAATNVFTNAGTLSAITLGSIAITDAATDGSVTITNAAAGAGGTLTLATAAGSNGTLNFAGNATAGTITIDADGSGDITRSAGFIGNATGTATVSLISGSGTIGTGTVRNATNIFTNAGTLSAVTGGSIAITDNATDGLVSVNGSSAGAAGLFQLATATGSNGTISLLSPLTAGSITLDANGSGNLIIPFTIGTGTTDIILVSGTGNIGTGAVRIATNVFTDAGNLTLQTGGSVAVTDVASDGLVTLLPSSAGGTFQLSTNNNGTVAINGGITANTITVDAAGSGDITRTAGTIGNAAGTATVLLQSNSGNIGFGTARSATNVFTNAGTLQLNTSGNATVTDLATTGSVSLSSSTSGALTAATQTGSNGTIAVTGGLVAASITLDADGSGSITSTGLIGNGTSNVTLLSGTGNIGTAVTALNTAAAALSANTAGAGSVFLSNANGVALGASSAGATFSLTAPSVTTTGNLTAAAIQLSTPSLTNNNTIQATNTFTMANSTGVTISGAGILQATTLGLNAATGTVNANQAEIVGTIGGTAAGGFGVSVTNSGLSAANITVTAGNINLGTTLAGAALQTSGVLTASGSITLNSAGTISSNAATTAGTTISATAPGNINASNSLTAQANSITLASSGGSIGIADATQITAYQDITMSALSGISIGTIGGGAAVNIAAGRLASGFGLTYTLLPANSVLSNGNLNLVTTGANANINVGDNVVLRATGGLGSPLPGVGNLALEATGTISTGGNASFQAWGGFASLKANVDVNLGSGNQLISIGKLYDAGGTFITTKGVTLDSYSGGGVAVIAGVPALNPTTVLNAMIQDRGNTNQITVSPGIPFNLASPNLQLQTGSSILVQATGVNQVKNVNPAAGNVYQLTGGVVFIDPIGSPSVNFNNTTIIAVGSDSPPAPPVVPTPVFTAPPLSSSAPRQVASARAATPTLSVSIPSQSITNPLIPTDKISWSLFTGQGLLKDGSGLPNLLGTDDGTTSGSGSGQLYSRDGPGWLTRNTTEADFAAVEDGVIELRSGEILVSTTSRLRVICKSAKATVYLAPGTVAIIDVHGDRLKVRNLWESQTQSLTVEARNRSMKVIVGSELITAASAESLAKAREDSIGRRNVHEFTTSDGSYFATSEIALGTLIGSTRLLQRLSASPDKADQKLYAKVLKMTACLNVVTTGHGSYSIVDKAPKTTRGTAAK